MECCIGIARKPLVVEDFEIVGHGNNYVVTVEGPGLFIACFFYCRVVMEDSCLRFETGDSGFYARHVGNHTVGELSFTVKALHFSGDPENAVFISMKTVE